MRILEELMAADFSIYGVAVDKRRLLGEGFQYRKSFYKFLNNLVYKELFRTFPKLTLTVDEHGDNDFMRQFKKYVQKQHISDLFGGSEFGFSSSPDSILIQLADFIAGTLRRCYDERYKGAESPRYFALLKPKITSILHFPDVTRGTREEAAASDSSYNETVAELGIQTAKHFIDNKTVIDEDDRDQVNCAKLLMLYFNAYGSQSYLTATDIMNHLNAFRDEKLPLRRFQTKTIAPLRDAGVLVVSSASGDKKGYKLPSSLEDLHKYVSHGNSMIMPMLHRIKIFRDKIKLASHNEIDILDKAEFAGLQKLME